MYIAVCLLSRFVHDLVPCHLVCAQGVTALCEVVRVHKVYMTACVGRVLAHKGRTWLFFIWFVKEFLPGGSGGPESPPPPIFASTHHVVFKMLRTFNNNDWLSTKMLSNDNIIQDLKQIKIYHQNTNKDEFTIRKKTKDKTKHQRNETKRANGEPNKYQKERTASFNFQ